MTGKYNKWQSIARVSIKSGEIWRNKSQIGNYNSNKDTRYNTMEMTSPHTIECSNISESSPKCYRSIQDHENIFGERISANRTALKNI